MQTEIIKVTGMTCGGCVSVVTKTLKAVNGVIDVNVSLSAAEAVVQYDESLTSSEELKFVIKEAGYGVEASDNPQLAPGKGCCG